MKRFHAHVAVDNLSECIRFYSTMLATDPIVTKTAYAKWVLDDPRINFAISQRGAKAGLDHLGMRVDSGSELNDLNQRLSKNDLLVFLTENCCDGTPCLSGFTASLAK
ncbi:MAG: hypothetical protein ABL903_11860 [Methylococcales bacterium]